MSHPRFILTLSVLLVMIAASAGALDNDRRGFVIGLGLGWGSATQSLTASGGGLDLEASTSSSGLATDFRIGLGLSERWLLYFTNQQVFFRLDETDFAQGLTGIGTTYFFQPQAPAFLLEAALGAGVLWDADERESADGFGVLLGLGYEFSRHFLIKADWSGADVGEAALFDTNVKASIGTFRITLNWLGY